MFKYRSYTEKRYKCWDTHIPDHVVLVQLVVTVVAALLQLNGWIM